MNPSHFVITRFKNRNGVLSWRVDGRLAGVRIRKNLKTREEAAAEKSSLEIQAVQAKAGLRSAVTFLSDAQLREAEDAFRRLAGKPASLLTYLDSGFLSYRDPKNEVALADAKEAYLSARRLDGDRQLVTEIQLRDIRRELGCLEARFPGARLSSINAETLKTYLERGNPGLKTQNNRRSLVLTFFRFAVRKGWISINPAEQLTHFRIAHRKGSAATLSAAVVKELMRYVEEYENGALVPFFALCLFAGIRPDMREGEISKIKPEHVRLDTGVINVEPEVSKVRMKRQVTIQPNLAAWLTAYPFKGFDYPYMEYHKAQVMKRFPLSHDVMRHTFISMFVAKFRSMGEAALQAGNSESIIRKHYLDLKSKAEAEEFFAIVPAGNRKTQLNYAAALPVLSAPSVDSSVGGWKHN